MAVLGWLVLVALHLALASRMEGPMLFGDEPVPIAIARWLGRVGPYQALASTGMKAVSFYHAGYSLLLLPAVWLWREPLAIYRWALTVNAGLLAAIFQLALHYARRVSGLDRWPALGVAAAAALYTGLV